MELVRYYNDALKRDFAPVVNYLAWPLQPTLDIAWQAHNSDVLKVEKIAAPDDLINAGLIHEIPRGGDISAISNYVWARCLTAMREKIVENTQYRIKMGGKTLEYKGKYPGLVEEALLTLQAGKPLFLLSGYGCAARAIIQAKQVQQPKQLTHDYQCANAGYNTLLEDYNQQIQQHELPRAPIDYAAINQAFLDFGINGLNNGLNKEENLRLFETVNHEEAIGLILTVLARTNQT